MKVGRAIASLLGALGISIAAGSAADSVQYEKSLKNLMIVLRESESVCKRDGVLKPMGHASATLADGTAVDMDPAWFAFIGDMHIRFVYNGPASMRGLTAQEFTALKLTPEQAVRLAMANIKRAYGSPRITSWDGYLSMVQGESPDLDSSYFLDQDFWEGLLQRYPQGLVAAVPKRGGLVFLPLSDESGVRKLRDSVAALYSTSEKLRVSSALYLFKDHRWSIFQDTCVIR